MRITGKYTGIFRCLPPDMKPTATLTSMQGLSVALGVLIFCAIGCTGCPLPEDTPCLCEFNEQNQYIINCRYRQLQAVPQFTNSSIEVYEVALFSCMIPEIPANAFSVLNVKRIDLGANPIRSIHRDAFNGIGDTLTELVLHVDQFSPPEFPTAALSTLPLLNLLHISKFDVPSLPTGALAPFGNLRDLSITNSKLETISDTDFVSQQNSLEVLHLESNELTQLPTEALSVLDKLKKLDLTLNNIAGDIPTNAFINNIELEEIDLSNNVIYPIREGAFSGITQSLKTLHMRSNKLTRFDLDKIGTLRALEDLDLSYNGDLTAIGNGVFSNMHQLQKLNLHGCYIARLTQDSFSGIKDSLGILQIAENKIISIETGTFSGFTQLEDLYLDHQDLGNVLDADTFSGLESSLKELSLEDTGFNSLNWPAVKNLAGLTKLKLRDNQIDSVPDFALEKLSQLETLDLSQNAVSEVTQRSMTGPQNSLTSVEFGTNLMTTVTQCAFDGFQELQHIGIKDNPLHCDCNLKWLRVWVDENYSGIEKEILDWRCATPPNHTNKKFVDLTTEDLDNECTTAPPPVQCEVFTSTTPSTTSIPTTSTTVSSTTLSTTTDSLPNPTTHSLLVNVSEVTDSTCTVHWFSDTNGDIENFIIDVTHKDSGDPVSTHTADKDNTEYLLENLEAATDYKVCVTMWIQIDGLLDEEIGCVDFSTKTTHSPVKQEGSNLSTILGAVFGILGVIALIVIVAILVIKCRGKSPNIFAKKTDGSPSGRSGKPAMGDNSKRFSKAKHNSQEIHAQNVANKNIEHFKNYNLEGPSYKHIDLQRDLERFNPYERERILNMLTHSGGSHISTISVGSQRYVPEPPPPRPVGMVEDYLSPQRPVGMVEDYLNPQPMEADGYLEPHTYVEIENDEPQISKECYI